MIGQAAQPRIIPACPPEFADEFVRGGWRRVERLYNARTDLLLKWIEQSGGRALLARRQAAKAGQTAVKPHPNNR